MIKLIFLHENIVNAVSYLQCTNHAVNNNHVNDEVCEILWALRVLKVRVCIRSILSAYSEPPWKPHQLNRDGVGHISAIINEVSQLYCSRLARNIGMPHDLCNSPSSFAVLFALLFHGDAESNLVPFRKDITPGHITVWLQHAPKLRQHKPVNANTDRVNDDR